MFLLLCSLILILAIIARHLAFKAGIPALLLFLCLGIIFHSCGLVLTDFVLAESISNIALAIIIFYGGFCTNYKSIKPVYKPAIVLASLGVLSTSLLSGLFIYYFFRLDLLTSFLIGSIVGSTDFASVSNILVAKKLNLKKATAPLLELESGANDPGAYTLTFIFLSLLLNKPINIPLFLFKQIFFGVFLGLASGFITYKISKRIKLVAESLFVVYVASIMLGTYSLSNLLGGNGFLSLYLLGIYWGNKEFKHKRDIIFFYDGLSNIIEIMLFFLLGLLASFNQISNMFIMGLIITLFMLFIARPLTLFILTKPFNINYKQNIILSLAGIKGAAGITFALMAHNNLPLLKLDIFHLVLVICLCSLLIQGSLLAPLTAKLDMYDSNDTVFKNFNYYQIKASFNFLEIEINRNSLWLNKKIKDLNFDSNLILAKIVRHNKTLIPNGQSKIKEGDKIILAGKAYFDERGEDLEEIRLKDKHPWLNQKIKDLHLEKKLIIMLKRENGKVVVPYGETTLKLGDTLVIYALEN